MTHRTQSLHFAGRAWSHGQRTLCDRVGMAHMTHIDGRYWRALARGQVASSAGHATA